MGCLPWLVCSLLAWSTVYGATRLADLTDDPVSSAKGCVRDLSSLSYDAVKDCSAGKEGNKLEHSMGAKTESLDPPHKYVPWVVVNGEHTDELQEKAQSDLLGLVCSLYQGAQPAECNTGETVL